MPTSSEIPVIILCGGQGTRLREETEYRPKPMVEIGPHPILWHIMKIYAHHGLDRFVLCLGYKGWEIKRYFMHYGEMSGDFTLELGTQKAPVFHEPKPQEHWSITLAETGAMTATGARLKKVARYVDSDIFCFTYGDAVASVDISALIEFHRREGRLATVTGVRPTSRYGEMRTDGSRVTEFREKPTAEGVVSGGFFVLDRKVFDYLSDDQNLFFELDPLRNLAREGQLSVFLHEGFWHPMDTYRDYLALNEQWQAGDVPWRCW